MRTRPLICEAVLDAWVRANPIDVSEKAFTRMVEANDDELKAKLLRAPTPEQRAEVGLKIPRGRVEAGTRKGLAHVLVMRAIADKEDITVDDDEEEQRIKEIADAESILWPKARSRTLAATSTWDDPRPRPTGSLTT